jgi:hypothetical protein
MVFLMEDVDEQIHRAEVAAREFAAMVEELCPDGGFLFGLEEWEEPNNK